MKLPVLSIPPQAPLGLPIANLLLVLPRDELDNLVSDDQADYSPNKRTCHLEVKGFVGWTVFSCTALCVALNIHCSEMGFLLALMVLCTESNFHCLPVGVDRSVGVWAADSWTPLVVVSVGLVLLRQVAVQVPVSESDWRLSSVPVFYSSLFLA